jgi:hypothetical protein
MTIFAAIRGLTYVANEKKVNKWNVADELLSLLRLVGVQWLYTTAELIGHVQAVQPQYPQLKVQIQTQIVSMCRLNHRSQTNI